MLTGEPPFTGLNSQAIVAKVLTEQPPLLRLKRPLVPSAVENAVLTALQKLPADRYGSAKDFADALEGKGTYAATVAMSHPERSAGSSRLSRLSRPVMLAALALTAIAAGAAGWLISNARRAGAPVLRYTTLLPDDQPLADSRGHRVAISPDGTRLVYAGRGADGAQLWLRNRNQLRAAPIAGATHATIPFFSPDGMRIGYTSEGNTDIRVITLTGAPPMVIADSAIGADGATWSEDGFVYFDGLTGGGTTGILRVTPNGAKVIEQVTTVDTARGEQDHFWPNALPKGRGVLFTIQSRGNADDRSELAVLDTKTMKVRKLVQALTGRYSPSGYLLYVTATGELLAVKFDLDRLEVTGEPFAVASGIARRSFGAIDLALSASGTLVYQAGGAAAEPGQVVYVNRDGSTVPVDSTFVGTFETLALSPDGRNIAISKIEGTEQQVWTKKLPDGPLSKLTFGGNRSIRPTWSPDGQYVGYIGNQGSGPQFYRKRADGSGPVEAMLTFPGRATNEAQWSRDGKWLVFRTAPPDIFARRTSGDTALVPLVQTSFEEITFSLSPDGRWLAYSSNESGVFEVYVRPFPDASSAKWQVSSGGGIEPRWTPDGRELLYWTGVAGATDQLQSITVVPGPTFVAGQHSTLPIFGAPYVGAPNSWDITPDGKRFVMIRQGAGTGDDRELVVVENLPGELTAQRTP
jgi:Tol biopolymer transport system component